MEDEALIRKTEQTVRLPAFEGPLDLLLFLIRRNEIDIYNIPIQEILEQYLSTLRQMERLDLEVAGDFFVMASTLMYIKSRLLLPQEKRDEDVDSGGEDDVDPRWELVEQLLQYRRVKEAAADLQELIAQANELLPRRGAESTEDSPRMLHHSDHVEVWNTFNRVLRRLSERLAVGEIEGETVTVADRMEYVLDRLKSQSQFTFSSLIDSGVGFQTVVATFLALLELARLRHVDLTQQDAFQDILCVRPDWLRNG